MPVLPFKEQSPILGENVYIAPGADGMYRRYINLARTYLEQGSS
ncbi:MAG: hypothetical protein SCJ97_03925 [Bacillota bacterium]|nr:hypothetical protein [Bacillota bacterium]